MKTTLILSLLIVLSCSASCQEKTAQGLSDQQIIEHIDTFRPLKGAKIPDDIKHHLGTTHVAGKYYFTDEPFLIEGCKKVNEMGYGVIKLWFQKNPQERFYHFNSEWNLNNSLSLKELAQHPYYKTCFGMPFSTIALSVGGAGVKTTDETSQIEEKEIYELTKYLLEEYKDREITFILHNWEGDWLMRGGTGNHARWSRTPGQLVNAVDGERHTVPVPDDSLQRVDAMVKWFTARQSGVSKARAEVKNSKCRVYHAIEANKVMDSMEGIPGIVNYVLPRVETDMVSWSSYDGLDANGLKLYKGIKYINGYIRPTDYMQGEKVVFLGEIGIPEQRYEGLTEKKPVVDRWDAYIGVCLALDIPYLIHWELYCNEPKDESLRRVMEKRTTEEMRGFWLIRPDGSKSFVGEYFEKLLQNSGKKLL